MGLTITRRALSGPVQHGPADHAAFDYTGQTAHLTEVHGGRGAASGSLTILSKAPTSPSVISLTGTGVAATQIL